MSRRVPVVLLGLRLLLLLCLALLAASPLPTPGYAQDAAPTPAPADTTATGTPPTQPAGPSFGLPDPSQWVGETFERAVVSLLNALSDGLRSLVEGVLQSSANVISQTPPALTYASPTVEALREPVQRIANAGLLLAAVWGGLSLMLRQRLGAAYPDVLDQVSRLATGAVLVNTSGLWARLLIDLNNALCAVVGSATPPGWEQTSGASQALVNALAALVYLVAALLLVIQMLVRVALVDVLLITAPLGGLCWVLPQTHDWADRWVGTYTRTVFAQFLQVVALKLGASLITELSSASVDASVLARFLGIAAILLVLKIPSLVGGQGGGFGFLQYAGYQQGGRLLGAAASRLGGGRGA